MSKIHQLVRTVQGTLKANSPTILTSVAAAGAVTTMLLTARSSVQAYKALLAEIEDHGPIEDPKEILKITWKYYIPPVLSCGLTVATIISANSISSKRNAALISAYSISEKAFHEYRDKVTEQIGENKERKVRDAIAQDKVAEKPVSSSEVIITGGGDVICYESYTGRYFKSDMEKLRKAQNDFNAWLLSDMYASLNSWFGLIGLQPTTMGDELGWNADQQLEVQFSSVLDETGKPALVIGYNYLPRPGYTNSFR